MRIVLDTNIIVRAYANSKGLAHGLLMNILAGPHALLLSNEMVGELSRVLRYPRFMVDHGDDEEEIYEFISWLRHSAELVPVSHFPVAPIRDSNDIFVLQAALNGEANIICTLDRDFFELPASAFLASRGIAVLTDVQLMRKLRARSV